MTCCFFGHRDTPDCIAPHLEQAVRQVIEQNGITRFLVGHQGSFDRIVIRVLSHLQAEYPQIRCYIVLYRMPENTCLEYPLETLYPEVLAGIPAKFAIDRRNQWMLAQSSAVISFVRFSTGCSKRYLSMAEKSAKICINLANFHSIDQITKESCSIL